MSLQKQKVKDKPSYLWLLLAVILFLCFVLLQLPASWLVKRFLPNQTYLEAVNGSLWQGQAQWQLPAHMLKTQLKTQNSPLSGSLKWKWRPWELLWLQAGGDIELSSGSSQISGRVGITRKQWQIQDLNGKLSALTLKQLLPLTWPNTDITLNGVALKNTYKGENKNWEKVAGLLTWSGGNVGYPVNGRIESANLPAMKAMLSDEDNKLHIALVDTKDKRMGDLYLDNKKMLDIQLTQRLLLNVKGYKGNAAPDTAVVSVRQPISSLGK